VRTQCRWDETPYTCDGLHFDLAAPTAALCRSRCCNDPNCERWEFAVGNLAGCHLGVPVSCSRLEAAAGEIYAMGFKLNGTGDEAWYGDGLALATPPPPPSLPSPAGGGGAPANASSDGGGVRPPAEEEGASSAPGERLEVVIIALCVGLLLLVGFSCCVCYWCYDQTARTRRVHPRSALKPRARGANAYVDTAPKVHTVPVLSRPEIVEPRAARNQVVPYIAGEGAPAGSRPLGCVGPPLADLKIEDVDVADLLDTTPQPAQPPLPRMLASPSASTLRY